MMAMRMNRAARALRFQVGGLEVQYCKRRRGKNGSLSTARTCRCRCGYRSLRQGELVVGRQTYLPKGSVFSSRLISTPDPLRTACCCSLQQEIERPYHLSNQRRALLVLAIAFLAHRLSQISAVWRCRLIDLLIDNGAFCYPHYQSCHRIILSDFGGFSPYSWSCLDRLFLHVSQWIQSLLHLPLLEDASPIWMFQFLLLVIVCRYVSLRCSTVHHKMRTVQHLTVFIYTTTIVRYEVTTSKFNRSIVREVATGGLASFFLGFGSLFLLLWTGVYV